MIPRGAPYIGWSDLAAATTYIASPRDANKARQLIERTWARNSVVFLSVRSGLDALLQVLALPAGSEIIISAITIPHVVEIIARHGLVAVPVDIDLATLSVNSSDVQRAVTERTRMVLVAHLFGSRMPLDDIVRVGRTRELLVVEDCAQAYDGSDYRGHEGSDVTMFSFGSIKRQTALGGAIMSFRDPALAESVRAVQSSYPQQSRAAFANRVLKILMVKLIGTRAVFPTFVRVCGWLGRDHDATLGTALRGFAGGDLLARLRQQPSGPLIRLLARRLRQSPRRAIADRAVVVETVTKAFPELRRPGATAGWHTHWVFPIISSDPGRLMRQLWAAGFDATCGASNLLCVPAPAGVAESSAAAQLMNGIVYLPLFPGTTVAEAERLANVLRELGCRESDVLPAVASR